MARRTVRRAGSRVVKGWRETVHGSNPTAYCFAFGTGVSQGAHWGTVHALCADRAVPRPQARAPLRTPRFMTIGSEWRANPLGHARPPCVHSGGHVHTFGAVHRAVNNTRVLLRGGRCTALQRALTPASADHEVYPALHNHGVWIAFGRGFVISGDAEHEDRVWPTGGGGDEGKKKCVPKMGLSPPIKMSFFPRGKCFLVFSGWAVWPWGGGVRRINPHPPAPLPRG